VPYYLFIKNEIIKIKNQIGQNTVNTTLISQSFGSSCLTGWRESIYSKKAAHTNPISK
jgi:hypothetical protein